MSLVWAKGEGGLKRENVKEKERNRIGKRTGKMEGVNSLKKRER
jgi:hypothetical protein